MKILKYKHEYKHDNVWLTRILYRKTTNDLVITQSNKNNSICYREICIFDETKDVIMDLYLFLGSIIREKRKGE